MSVAQCLRRPRCIALRDATALLMPWYPEVVVRRDIFLQRRRYGSVRQQQLGTFNDRNSADQEPPSIHNEQDTEKAKADYPKEKHEPGAFASEMRSLFSQGYDLKERTPLELDVFQNVLARKDRAPPATLQEKNLAMLDYYDELSILEGAGGEQTRGYEVVLPDTQTLDGQNSRTDTETTSLQHAAKNAQLLSTGLRSRILSRQLAYELYRKLPSPGVAHLKRMDRHLLLVKMSQVYVTERNEQAMMQYLSIFDDLSAAGITPELWQWAAAMHLTGRYVKTVTVSELENAMRIWKRMEEGAGIQSNITTMNILLDIALKSRHLDLADLLVDEIRQRGLNHDRFTYMSVIHLNGLRGNGDGIRGTYKDLVKANEVVDSMVLTCVIGAFLRSGELAAAMNVYRRMQARAFPSRDSHESTAKTTWDLGRLIAKFNRDHGKDPQMLEEIQGEVTVQPNIITYVNLIGHHATQTGELLEIVGLLDEMRAANIRIHGSIFKELFSGFALHGGKMFTSWTEDRLEDVWSAFKTLADEGIKDVFVGPVIALKVLEAFKECAGKARALEVIDELRVRWRKRDETHVFDEEWLKYEAGLRSRRAFPRRNATTAQLEQMY